MLFKRTLPNSFFNFWNNAILHVCFKIPVWWFHIDMEMKTDWQKQKIVLTNALNHFGNFCLVILQLMFSRQTPILQSYPLNLGPEKVCYQRSCIIEFSHLAAPEKINSYLKNIFGTTLPTRITFKSMLFLLFVSKALSGGDTISTSWEMKTNRLNRRLSTQMRTKCIEPL